MEKFGEPPAFQIECIHEPAPNTKGYVFGRMCLRFDSDVLGDLDEPACMLDVTAKHLQDILNSIDTLDAPELFAMTDKDLWAKLDNALYRDDSRTDDEVAADSREYSRFNFLTNGGESFDRSKSFIIAGASQVRILFRNYDKDGSLVGKTLDRHLFANAVQSFLEWLDGERVQLKTGIR